MSNIIAIVGRPNVGKSTLFNRLTELRKAITESEPGITRDRHYGSVEWGGRQFALIDTGGYVIGSEDTFEKEILSQIHIAVDEANLLLFLVDCKDGLTGFDHEIAQILRTTKKPILLIANKADNISRELYSSEFYKLGLGDIYPISSISGYGTGDLMEAISYNIPAIEKTKNEENIPRISILGRPNVGKSSLLNVLLGEKRSIVTAIAGTTRDAIDTHYTLFGKNFLITDTAGIRKKNKVKENIEFYSTVRSFRALFDSDVCILMLDAEKGLESQDMHLISMAHKYKKGIVLVVNKWDLIEKNHKSTDQYKRMLMDKLAPFTYIPILFVSALTKQRIFKTIEKTLDVYNNRAQKIPTNALNTQLLPAIEKYPPPAVKGKYIKIKYITQLPTKTPTFAFFCNLPQYIKKPYQSYLENKIRSNFIFEGVPVKVIFRKK